MRRYDQRRDCLLRVARLLPEWLVRRAVLPCVSDDGDGLLEGDVNRWSRYATEVCSHDSLTPYWLNGLDFWAKYPVRSIEGTNENEVLRAREYSSAYVVPVLCCQL